MSTNGLGVVASPPAVPPIVGLLAALKGPPYLIDDTDSALGDIVNGPNAGDPDLRPGTTDEVPVRWEGAVRYNPEQTCIHTGAENPCSVATMSIPANPSLVEAQPFLVWAGDKCSSFGWAARDYKGRATRALVAAESKVIANELWLGTETQAAGWPNPYLAAASAIVLSASAQSPANALDFLEQGLADCSTGLQGVIHCTRQLGSFLSGLGNTLRTVDGLIVTYSGTIIIPDAGYPGSGPAGQPAATTQWAYATLMPTVRRSPIEVVPDRFEEAIIRSTNDLEWRAYRYAVATFPPCCLLACEVSLPAPVGGAS